MGLPDPLQRLVDRLEGGAYTRTADVTETEAFGDRLIELSDGARDVRLVRDRGDWAAQLRVAGAWWDSELVLAALDGTEATVHPLGDESLAAATLEALGRLPEDEAAAELLRQTVEKTAERRAPRLFGD